MPDLCQCLNRTIPALSGQAILSCNHQNTFRGIRLDDQVRRLLEYCELPFEDACINFHQTERPVRTASSEQVRQPVYRKSVNFWRNHEEHLAELIEVLEPILPRYQQSESINRP